MVFTLCAFSVATQLSFPASSDQLLPQSQACPLGVCLGHYLLSEPPPPLSCSDPASGGPLEGEASESGWRRNFSHWQATGVSSHAQSKFFPLPASYVHH